MDTRNLTVPLLAFAGGAILGRLFGLKTLARRVTTAAAVTGMTAPAGLLDRPRAAVRASVRRRTATRAARKAVAQKKSRRA